MNALQPVRVAIVGLALNLRVEHHQLASLQVVATSPNAALAGEALRGLTADVLLIELPTLHRETSETVRSLAQQLGARRIVVEYGLGSQRDEQALRALGCSLVHAPLDIEQLESLCGAPSASFQSLLPSAVSPINPAAPRRFDDRALAEFFITSVQLNCECMHHLADLLIASLQRQGSATRRTNVSTDVSSRIWPAIIPSSRLGSFRYKKHPNQLLALNYSE